MLDKAEARTQDKCQAGLKLNTWCLLGLSPRFTLIRQVPAVERSENALDHHLLQMPMGFMASPPNRLCGRSPLPHPFLLLAAECGLQTPALLPVPAMLPLGNTPKPKPT